MAEQLINQAERAKAASRQAGSDPGAKAAAADVIRQATRRDDAPRDPS